MHDNLPPPQTRRERLWRAAESRGIPLRAILATVGVVVGAYLVGKLLFRLRDVILIMVVAGFIALLLNPLGVVLRLRPAPSASPSPLVTLLSAGAAFGGLAFAFGYPLVNGLSHLATAPADLRGQGGAGRRRGRPPGDQISAGREWVWKPMSELVVCTGKDSYTRR